MPGYCSRAGPRVNVGCIYVSGFFASIKPDLPARLGSPDERAPGFFPLRTGICLFCLMLADILTAVLTTMGPIRELATRRATMHIHPLRQGPPGCSRPHPLAEPDGHGGLSWPCRAPAGHAGR